MANKITLQIPQELNQKLEEKIKGTNFKSIQEYILFVLEQMMSGIGTKKQEGYSEEEEADLKQMLKDMGYLT